MRMTREQVARRHIMYSRLHRAAMVSVIDVSDVDDTGTHTAILTSHCRESRKR